MYEKELKVALEAAAASAELIKKVYATDFDVEIKSDSSPVTEADKGADALIREIIGAAFPRHGFLTEESKDDKKRLKKEFVWIIDPVDGTKDFVSKDDEFTTNIALCRNHEIVLGIINVPMKNLVYYAIKGEGSYRKDGKGKISLLRVNDKTDNLTVLASRSFFNLQEKALIEKHSDKIVNIARLGAATKFCAIAEGQAEISYRMSANTKEWDTAAGDLILSEAGGFLLQPDGTPLTYNRDDVYNRNGYLLLNKKENFLI